MNNPYPSNHSLAVEEIVDALLAEQAVSAAAFRDALNAFAAVFDRLEFPLGCPVAGYDLADIHGSIADWGLFADDREDLANEIAASMMEDA